MPTETITPRVWIGALGAYNAGHLIGHWVDATDLDELTEVADAVIAEAQAKLGYEGGEEIMLADNEGFGNIIGEYTPLSTVAKIGALIEDHGAAFLAWADHETRDFTDLDSIIEQFESESRGEYDSERQYAYEQFEDWIGIDSIEDNPLNNYIDWDIVEREMFHHGPFYYVDGFMFESEQ